ncbi:uncharacterized protein KD926_003769 [Aspergillus affinis]|uniref:uncharacterized protein n=1 Tax=Aspergillus affinis TaxID=1070780 RepID=UPI0022FDFAD1|nr:uncharacterized protein KD926_003769 [Aspergillus affinis]KAI9035296.1 hypothetical protein KD926_003769 [Aspergillus affinis]
MLPPENRQLGLDVPPEKVRLQPRQEDPYRWSVAKPVKPHFKSNLSRGSVGDFQKICEALESRNLIEAVSPKSLQEESYQEDEHHDLVFNDNFTVTIQRLERERKEAISDNETLREKQKQELLDTQQLWETEHDGLRQEMLQWKHSAETQDLKLREMKEKIFPTLNTLNLHLSELFDKSDLVQ